MKPKNPLESVYFINIPEDYKFSDAAMKIDPKIPLPVQQKTQGDPDDFNMKDIAPEQILSGILMVLAYDKHNNNLDYYRQIINQARPNIKKELSRIQLS